MTSRALSEEMLKAGTSAAVGAIRTGRSPTRCARADPDWREDRGAAFVAQAEAWAYDLPVWLPAIEASAVLWIALIAVGRMITYC